MDAHQAPVKNGKPYWKWLLPIVAVLLFVYTQEFIKNGGADDLVLRARNLETPIKRWLNGYLGIFFNFSAFGNLNWLLLPLLFDREVRQLAKTRTAAFFLVFLAVSAAFIGGYGYFNDRYLGTVAPLVLCTVCCFCIKKGAKKPVWAGLLVLALLNTAFYVGNRFTKSYGKYFGLKNTPPPTEQAVIEPNTQNVFDQLNAPGTKQDTFINFNLPEFYRSCPHFGHYYIPNTDELYLKTGMKKMNGLSPTDRASFIKETLNCKYLLVNLEQLNSSPWAADFLAKNGTLLYADPIHRGVFQLK